MKNNEHKNNLPDKVIAKRKQPSWLKWSILFGTLGLFFCLVELPWKQSTAQVLTRPEEIKGKRITLKRLKEKYFIDYHNMFSATVRKNLEFPDSITLDYTIRYLKEEMRKDRTGAMLMYCIFDNVDNKLIGFLEIREKNDHDPGQFGCGINENYWGGGRFQEAFTLINELYFKLYNETSYIAHVRLWNKRSYAALKKVGFIDVGFFYENGIPTRYILEMRKDTPLNKKVINSNFLVQLQSLFQAGPSYG